MVYHENSNHLDQNIGIIRHKRSMLVNDRVFLNCVFATRLGSLELKIGSEEPEIIFIGSLEAEKIGSLESEKSGPYRSISGT